MSIKLPLATATTAIAVSLSVVFGIEALFAPMALIPTKNNIDDLKNVAHKEWADRGYKLLEFTDEKASRGGLISAYDLKVGGGILHVTLENSETGERDTGVMSYDTAGLLNCHIIKDKGPKPPSP